MSPSSCADGDLCDAVAIESPEPARLLARAWPSLPLPAICWGDGRVEGLGVQVEACFRDSEEGLAWLWAAWLHLAEAGP